MPGSTSARVVYGDLNQDGALSGPGEEVPGFPTGCCAIAIFRRLMIVSRDGAAETVLDFGGTLPGGNTFEGVSIGFSGTVLGRPREGFTVTGVGGLGAVRVEGAAIGVASKATAPSATREPAS